MQEAAASMRNKFSDAISNSNLEPIQSLSDDLTGKVLFGHPAGCICCRTLPDADITKLGELILANQSDNKLSAGAAGSNLTLATYLRSGFWTDFSSSPRKVVSRIWLRAMEPVGRNPLPPAPEGRMVVAGTPSPSTFGLGYIQ